MQDIAHGAGAVVPGVVEGPVAHAPDIGEGVERVRRSDRSLDLGRRIRRCDGSAVLADRGLPWRPNRGRGGRGGRGRGGVPGRTAPAGLRRGRNGECQHAQSCNPRYSEATLAAKCDSHPTVLLCRPAGLAVGLALKEPAPPPSLPVGSPLYLVPPLPPPRGDGTRRNSREPLPNVKAHLQST